MDPNSPSFVDQIRNWLDDNPEAAEEVFGESEAVMPDDEPDNGISSEEEDFEDSEEDE
jgi:hypothetical protein